MADWTQIQVAALQSHTGKHIWQWMCIEMALNDADDHSKLVWQHESIPMLQLECLYAKIDHGWQSFVTYQNDCEWGFGISVVGDTLWQTGGMTGIFRFRCLPELPMGQVTNVSWTQTAKGTLPQSICRSVTKP